MNSKFALTVMCFLFSMALGYGQQANPKSGGDVEAAAKEIIEAINSHDVIRYSKLFCDKGLYFKNMFGKNIEDLSNSYINFAYSRAERQFSDDCFAFWSIELGYPRPVQLRFISVRELPCAVPKQCSFLEIVVEYGSGSGTGRAYIVTGAGIDTPEGFRFLGRCQHLFSPLPLAQGE